MSRRFARTCTGSAHTVELAVSLCVLIPLILIVFLAAAEVAQAYLITTVLSQSAEQAARELAIQYANDQNITASRSLQDALVFENIRTLGVVNANEQFDDVDFKTTAEPKTVSVKVKYLSGQFGLSPFPFVAPLNIGANWSLEGAATYRLD